MFFYWNWFKRELEGLGETFQELEDVKLLVVVGQYNGRPADAVSGVDVSPGVDQKSNLLSEIVSIFLISQTVPIKLVVSQAAQLDIIFQLGPKLSEGSLRVPRVCIYCRSCSFNVFKYFEFLQVVPLLNRFR